MPSDQVTPMTNRPGPIPYLFVDNVDQLIAFCVDVFGAELRGRLVRPEGAVMHAEVTIDGRRVMMGEPMGEFEANPAWIFLYVDDCDATYAKALEAGGTSVMEVTYMQHAGERYGGVKDPTGNVWWIAADLDESVSWEEQQRRIDALAHQQLGR